MYEAADQSWHQHVLCLMQQNQIRAPPHPVSKSAAPWKLYNRQQQQSRPVNLQGNLHNTKFALLAIALRSTLQSHAASCSKRGPRKAARKGMMVADKNDAAETGGQHHLVPGKCDQIHSKTSHKRHNTPLVYQIAETRGQHHLVPGKCDQIHSKTSHKRHNTPLVYQMGQQC